jgi:hypothetical protein
MTFSLTYELSGTGWADARIGNGQANREVRISYLHDSLRELGELALALHKGQAMGTVSFLDEPGEHILELSRVHDELTFEVRWYDDWTSLPDDTAECEVVLRGVTSANEFVAAVRSQLLRLLERHGLEGYKALWARHDFPDDVLEQLEATAP